MFEHVFEQGVVGQARNETPPLLTLKIHNLRDYTTDKHKTVDDIPFGGGGGLIYKVEPLVKALRAVQDPSLKSRSILLSPKGRVFTHNVAKELSQYQQILLFCGRYEGVDERFCDYIDEELSVGDFILSGGEIAAMMVIDAVSRFIPGVVGQQEAPYQDSFEKGLLEYPYYTRPFEFEGKKIPEVLRSGHHEKIKQWKREQALNTTLQRRPDLLQKVHSFTRKSDGQSNEEKSNST